MTSTQERPIESVQAPSYIESEEMDSPAYSQVQPMSTGAGFTKPIVIPQTTNIFMIKTFSPFARSYSPALAQLEQPITQDEFLAFIDGLNEAFMSAPIFQAMHVAGGGLLGSQILPAQAVGGVFQVISVAGSAGVSMLRVRKYMKKMHAQMFAPRGLVVKIMTTKKMMAAIGLVDETGKGKIKLPPLETVADLKGAAVGDVKHETIDGEVEFGPEDPRMRRLRAIENYVAPLSFDVPADERKVGVVKRWTTAPLKWVNNRQAKKVDKVREKSLKKREEKAPEVEAEMTRAKYELADLDEKIHILRNSIEKQPTAEKEAELKRLEEQQKTIIEEREKTIQDIYAKGDKKLLKLYKKEEKVANRILWIVIQKEDGTGGDALVQVESNTSSDHTVAN